MLKLSLLITFPTTYTLYTQALLICIAINLLAKSLPTALLCVECWWPSALVLHAGQCLTWPRPPVPASVRAAQCHGAGTAARPGLLPGGGRGPAVWRGAGPHVLLRRAGRPELRRGLHAARRRHRRCRRASTHTGSETFHWDSGSHLIFFFKWHQKNMRSWSPPEPGGFIKGIG